METIKRHKLLFALLVIITLSVFYYFARNKKKEAAVIAKVEATDKDTRNITIVRQEIA